MKRKKEYISVFILAISFAVFFPARSESQTIDPTVEVKRDYDASMMNIRKPVLDTHVNDSLYRFRINFDYSTNLRHHDDLYEFSPLPFLELDNGMKESRPVFFSRLGFSIPTSPTAQLFYQPRLKNERTGLLLYGQHKSLWTKINGVAADDMDNNAGILTVHSWKTGHFFFKAEYNGAHRTYYGFNDKTLVADKPLDQRKFMKDNLSSDVHNMDLITGVKSANTRSNAFDYEFNLNYSFTGICPRIEPVMPVIPQRPDNLQEHYGRFYGLIGPTFAGHHKIHINYDLELMNYSNSCTYGMVNLNPKYRYERNRWAFDLGVNISFPFSSVPDENFRLKGRKQLIFPDASVSFTAVKKSLIIYADASGKDNLTRLYDLHREYRWVSPEFMVPGINTEALKVNLGIKGSVKETFTYNIYAGYGITDNAPTLINKAGITSLTEVIYQSYNCFSAGAEMIFKIKNMDAGISAAYYGYHNAGTERPFLKTPFEAKLYGRYNWRDRILVRADLEYRHETTAGYMNGTTLMTTELGSFINLGINISYMLNENFSIFIEGKNLTDSKQEYVYGYTLPGINFGAGISIRF